MEHIVQFAVGIDDDAIVKRIEKYATEQITTELKQQVANKLFASYNYYRRNANPETDPLSDYAISLFKDFIEDHKEEIIEKVVNMLSSKMMKSRTVQSKIIDKL